MALQNPKELFLYDLSSLYMMEQEQLKMLPQMAQECDDPKARSVIQEHEQETRQQVQNLEQCFRVLNSQPKQMESCAATGLKRDHDMLAQQNPSKEVMRLWTAEKGVKSEHMEIASYKVLIGMAIHMGEIRCVDLLEQNCMQEEAMAAKMSQIAYKMGESMTQVRA